MPNVARRLDFGEDDQAATENYNNALKEQIEDIVLKMTEKYNFDFKNETALRGAYVWMKRTETGWVPMAAKKLTEGNDNEMTPMHSKTADRAPPRRRKMPRDDKGVLNSHVKKRLMME